MLYEKETNKRWNHLCLHTENNLYSSDIFALLNGLQKKNSIWPGAGTALHQFIAKSGIIAEQEVMIGKIG